MRKNFLAFWTLMGVMAMIGGCGGAKVESYAGGKPEMRFDEFFNGPMTGHAIVQDRSGKIIRRFVVEMVGSWSGDTGTLEEHFVYSDGEVQDRVWNIRKNPDGTFTGTAADIVGEAKGRSAGNAIKWEYVMTLDVGGRKIDVSFDDWMFLMTEDLVLNRSYMKKFGVRVGEITISIQKNGAGK